jgi:iron complex outermembrane receptor protein
VCARAARADDDERDNAADDVLVRGIAGRSASGFVSHSRIEDEPREVTDAASLVEAMPGVHVRRLGADDSFATLSVRGTSSTEVAIFLAGVPLTGGADPTLDLATLPLWPGARARVYRSFAPATLGRGSLGGTLVLDVPSPNAEARTDVWTAVGSFGSRRLRLGDVRAVGGASGASGGSADPGGVRVATGISASRSDDDFSYLDPLASEAKHTDVFATRVNAGHAAANGLASIVIPLGKDDDHTLTITTLAQARRQELPGTIDAPTPYQRLESSRVLEAIELGFPLASGTLGVRAWGRRETIAIRDIADGSVVTFGPSSTDDAIVATGGSVGFTVRPSERTSIDTRVDASAERYAPGTWIGATEPASATRASAGAAIDASARVAKPLTFAASARGDVWSDASDVSSARTTARPTGNIGAELAVDPVTIAAHGGVLARPASFVERFGDRGTFLGEPTLRPEGAATIDAGARMARRFGKLHLELEGATFATWADDLIVFVFVGASGRSKATNIGKARLLGLEASARAAAYAFDLRVSYTGLATANESECGASVAACDRPPLPGRPENDLVSDLGYQLGPAHLRYGIDVVTGARADLVGNVIVPDRVLHSAGARLAIPGVPGLVVALDVRNLFDLRVAEYAGAFGSVRAPIGDVFQYPLPGRTLLASARYTSPAP